MGSFSIKGSGVSQVTVVPMGNRVDITIFGTTQVGLRRFCVKRPVLKQENVLVTVCPENQDHYRFGFNGQEKGKKE